MQSFFIANRLSTSQCAVHPGNGDEKHSAHLHGAWSPVERCRLEYTSYAPGCAELIISASHSIITTTLHGVCAL